LIKFTNYKFIELYLNSSWLYFVHDNLIELTKIQYIDSNYEISIDSYLQLYSEYRKSKQPHHITLK
jgi:hypothetical protein